MTLNDVLKAWTNKNDKLNVTALAYYKEDKSYFSFRSLINMWLNEVKVKDYKTEFSEDELQLEVRSISYYENTLCIEIIEWI